MKLQIVGVIALATVVSGCAMSSQPMQAEDGTYIISAAASPIRGGAAGASAVAFDEAQKFCSQQGMTARIVDVADRDVYQSSFGGSVNQYGGGFGGGTFAAGRTNLRFRCGR